MMTKSKLLLSANLITALFITSTILGQETLEYRHSLPEIVTKDSQPTFTFHGKDYKGNLISCSGSEISEGKCWNPSEEDVAKLEKGLPKYILSSIEVEGLSSFLPKYMRSYSGVYKSGKKIICVELYYYSEHWKKKETEATPEINMPSFSLDFDTQSGKFSGLKEVTYFDGSIIIPDSASRVEIESNTSDFVTTENQTGVPQCLVNGLDAEDMGNHSEAVKWYQKGVSLGDLACSIELAKALESGREIKKDVDKALELREGAAQQGIAIFPSEISECFNKSNDLYVLNTPYDMDDPFVYLSKKNSSVKTKFYEINRWVQVAWSPDGTHLMVTDGDASNETDTHIYKIDKNGKASKEKDPLDMMDEKEKKELDSFECVHFYFEGVEWVNNDEVLINLNGYGDHTEVERIYVYSLKNGFTRLK